MCSLQFSFLCSQDYLEKSKYITEQLSVLKTQIGNMKIEDRRTHNDILHDRNLRRRGSTKRALQERVGRLRHRGLGGH